MSGIRGTNTKPEMIVRKLLHSAGFRYRLHSRELPGRPDIVLRKHKTVIFVHGCFWHGHENCALFRLPKSRTAFWENKILGNIERDGLLLETLERSGWRVAIIWECALKGSKSIGKEALVEITSEFIRGGESRLEVRGR
jgi:DNA mismatch endonuclease (patch repair protein)